MASDDNKTVTIPISASEDSIPLTRSAYAEYGDIISVEDSKASCIPHKPANQGSAQRYNFVAAMTNLRPSSAVANVCLFRSNPHPVTDVFCTKLLERHQHSTQMFIPQ